MSENILDDFKQVRQKIFEDVKAELVGPGSEDIGPTIESEVISDSPIERYSAGILFPMDTKVGQNDDEKYNPQDEDIKEGLDDLDENNETKNTVQIDEKVKNNNYSKSAEEKDDINEQINMANQTLPAAMGMTFFITGNIDKLKVRVESARYRVSLFKDCCVRYDGDDTAVNTVLKDYVYIEYGLLKLKQNLNRRTVFELSSSEALREDSKLQDALYKLASLCSDDQRRKYGYVRVPLVFDNPIELDLAEDYSEQIVNAGFKLKIACLKRKYSNNLFGITMMLVNCSKGKKSIKNTVFQSKIRVNTEDNPEINFFEFSNSILNNKEHYKDEEELSLDLLYKNKKSFAVGHGTAVLEDVDNTSGKGMICTESLPYYEVPKLNFNIDELKEISTKVFSMKNLSDISKQSKDEKIKYLRQFSEIYKKWINSLEEEANELEGKYRDTASRHINDCKECFRRMNEGIHILEKDEDAFTSFSLMNRAMLMQRFHSRVKERFPYDAEIDYPEFDYKSTDEDVAKWRPFQLAFVLMSINGVVNPESEERKLVDLIWIPTGGGKTEAYLGVSAFTIFLRRLKNPKDGGGTAIIMRYTLRLLAAQQFIRASIMICACEKIRRERNYNLGKDEISIGLWVGQPPTPNSNKKAKECFKNLTANPRDNMALSHQKEMYNLFQILKCPWCGTKLEKEFVNKKQKGHWGYDYNRKKIIFCPEEDCEFNLKLPIQVVDEELYKNPPTLLFGTVDKFATMAWKGEVSSFFGLNNKYKSPELIIQDELHLISGPLGTIVGLYETALDYMCSAKGQVPKIIASTATIRRAKEQVKNLYNRGVKQFPPQGLYIEDSFFTREIPVKEQPGRLYVGIMPTGKTQVTAEVRLLGSMMQKIHLMDINDKLKDQFWTLTTYFNSLRELGKCSTLVSDDIKDFMNRLSQRIGYRGNTRYIMSPRELTSRLSSSIINKTLKDLEINYSEENKEKKIYPVNILLASNMISVGVDVSRLNTMVVVGQPKLTSEYIQATSRVGRNNPGVVFVLYNGSKSRDRSHYEKFYSYHKSFYKYVEPTSVTPFSEQARERALHAVFVTMVRHILGLNSNESASEFNRNLEGVDEIIDTIANRAADLDNTIAGDLSSDVREELYDFIDFWDRKKESSLDEGDLTYSQKDKKHLLKYFNSGDNENAYETLNSMRNVDGQSKVDIIIFGDEKNEEN